MRIAIFNLLCGALVATVFTGCWQEVHYNPPAAPNTLVADKQSVETPQPEQSLAESPTIETEITQPPDREPTVAEPADDSPPLSTDTLFGEESPSESNPVAETTPAPVEITPDPAEAPPAAFEETEILEPSPTALAAWQMSSRWSLAAAIYAKGQPEERYREMLAEASAAAEVLNVTLPSFPASDDSSREATMIAYLLDPASLELSTKLSTEYSRRYSSFAELAAKTHVLLLVYTPKSERLDPLVDSIREAAESSGLPRDLWGELVAMLETRAPFVDVKQQVLDLHVAVHDYLAGDRRE